jgi:cytochrome P450 family 3 subfamily A
MGDSILCQAVDDDVIGRYQIPAGTRVIVPIIAIHQNAELWPQPTAFRPERFETSPPHPYAGLGAPPLPAKILVASRECVDAFLLLPSSPPPQGFINGPRACLGQHFALLESKIVLSRLVQKFRFEACPKTSGDKHPYKIPICPIDGIHVLVTPRATQQA